MNIEVGEYVRTKYGIIGKYEGAIDYDEEGQKLYGLKVIKRFIPLFVREENIIKNSKNIIDLIEVGDYVNGQKVISKTKVSVWTKEDVINKNHIKSIVTGEQFENMEYRV